MRFNLNFMLDLTMLKSKHTLCGLLEQGRGVKTFIRVPCEIPHRQPPRLRLTHDDPNSSGLLGISFFKLLAVLRPCKRLRTENVAHLENKVLIQAPQTRTVQAFCHGCAAVMRFLGRIQKILDPSETIPVLRISHKRA